MITMTARMGFHHALALMLLVALIRDAGSAALPGEHPESLRRMTRALVSEACKTCFINYSYSYQPQCGNDGQTYPNLSILKCDKVCKDKPDLMVLHPGTC
ncbi:unnamed protein product [Bemisia tabaci]|uniref:Kazal-like domain-containing protein n=1 Tax=Bemisia tabaci TaxID=7038 RepID=A0A9P0CAH8_BEMTA|nr:unnamed protein product [Bemisia tabaci]